MEASVKQLELRGFKTLRELQAFQPGPLTVLIGANGAGKSNVISFFRMMSWMTSDPPRLQVYIGQNGGAGAILHDGAETTREIEATITIATDRGDNDYYFRLFHAAGDTLIFADERFRFSAGDRPTPAPWVEMGAGHRETHLWDFARSSEPSARTAKTIANLLCQCRVFQFHNTSFTARVRGRWDNDDNGYLREDAANLAPFLRRLRDNAHPCYQRIVDAIRQIVPFFLDFDLDADNGTVMLRWREEGSDVVFNASQASDGMLRAIALVTLLLQPADNLPATLILDEPELGLHPYAITVVAGLIRSVSKFAQILVATQSMTFIDHFAPEEIVVVERHGRETELKRLDSSKLGDWLQEYSIAELWEKNVLGGRPAK